MILPVVSQQVMIPVRVSGRGFLRLYSRKKVPASVLQVFFLHWKTITRYLYAFMSFFLTGKVKYLFLIWRY